MSRFNFELYWRRRLLLCDLCRQSAGAPASAGPIGWTTGKYSPGYLKLVLTEWTVGLQTIVAARRRTCPTRCRELAALNNCCLYGKLTVSLQLKHYLAEVKRGRGISGSAIGLLYLCWFPLFRCICAVTVYPGEAGESAFKTSPHHLLTGYRPTTTCGIP